MRFQLRFYTVRRGALDDFVREWTEHVRPLRLAHGFSVLGPWVVEDENAFVWIVGHDGDFDAADAAYYASPQRKALDPDPVRHLDEVRTWFMRAPAQMPARDR